MNPIPLTAPDGTVRAWACGECGYLRLPNGPVDLQREFAETCGVCRCGKPTRLDGVSCAFSCEECRRASEERGLALIERLRAAPRVTCEGCGGSGQCGHCEDECGRCDGAGTVEVTP